MPRNSIRPRTNADYDCSVEIKLSEASAQSWADEDGAVVSAMPLVQDRTEVKMLLSGYVHVTAIPGTIESGRLAEILGQAWYDETTEPPTLLARRLYKVRQDLISPTQSNALPVTRQIMVTWAEFKTFLRTLSEPDREPQDEDFS